MIVTRVERLEAAAPIEGNTSVATGGSLEAGKVRVFAFDVAASWSGVVDPASGMVVNLTDLKDALRRRVVEPAGGCLLDGKQGRPRAATPETLARWIWSRLDAAVPGVKLERVALEDGPRLTVAVTGGIHVPIEVTRVYEFSASHRLHAPGLSAERNKDVFGKCNNPEGHGHNYVLEVTLRGDPDESGEVAPAAIVNAVVREEVADRWDHKNLNLDLPEFVGVNPTAEEIVRIAWRRLAPALGTKLGTRARLHRLKLRETARNHVEYAGEGNE